MWLALGYAVAGIVMFILIITIPFGVPAVRWPLLAVAVRAHAGEEARAPALGR